jgi:1,4-alpha-glucan branching enzyme
MKYKALAAIIPLLFLAFNYDDGHLNAIYYSSLKLLKQADSPQKIKLYHSGLRSGQSMLASEGILFTYKNRGARDVQISGSFCAWKPENMERSDNGVWYYFLPAKESGRNITYKYLVDGICIMDPQNPERVDDRMGSYLSVVEPVVKTEGKHVSWRSIGGNAVEFRLYRPGASLVALVGDFNNWNPEDDLLSKGQDGIWRLRKKLFPGAYRYKFIVDGEWMPDLYNAHSGSDDTGEICSIIEIRK